MTMKHNLVGAGIVVALGLGTLTVPSTAFASERPATVSAASIADLPGPTNTTGSTRSAPVPLPPTSSTEASERGIGSIFIKAVKKYGASAYSAMVKAAKSSYSAFKRWFNGLPGWVKVASGGITVDALYDVIKSALGL